jgi:hypothetical protein
MENMKTLDTVATPASLDNPLAPFAPDKFAQLRCNDIKSYK